MSSKLTRILRELYPGVDSFTPEQYAFARRAVEVANADAKRSRIPRTDVPIGGVIYRKGRRYLCVERPVVGLPSEACSGCSFNVSEFKCIGLRCSRFDRSDGNNVWFQEVLDD